MCCQSINQSIASPKYYLLEPCDLTSSIHPGNIRVGSIKSHCPLNCSECRCWALGSMLVLASTSQTTSGFFFIFFPSFLASKSSKLFPRSEKQEMAGGFMKVHIPCRTRKNLETWRRESVHSNFECSNHQINRFENSKGNLSRFSGPPNIRVI